MPTTTKKTDAEVASLRRAHLEFDRWRKLGLIAMSEAAKQPTPDLVSKLFWPRACSLACECGKGK